MFKTMFKLYYMQLLYDYLKGIKTLFKNVILLCLCFTSLKLVKGILRIISWFCITSIKYYMSCITFFFEMYAFYGNVCNFTVR